MEEMKIEIKDVGSNKYAIFLDEDYFRTCFGYIDLAQVIGSLIKARFKKDYEGYI